MQSSRLAAIFALTLLTAVTAFASDKSDVMVLNKGDIKSALGGVADHRVAEGRGRLEDDGLDLDAREVAPGVRFAASESELSQAFLEHINPALGR